MRQKWKEHSLAVHIIKKHSDCPKLIMDIIHTAPLCIVLVGPKLHPQLHRSFLVISELHLRAVNGRKFALGIPLNKG